MTAGNETIARLARHEEEIRSDEHTQVSSVELDEMAFAISLFVAAARGRVPLLREQGTGFELRRELRLQDPVLTSVKETLVDMREAASDEIPLACAVAVIWHHYEGTEHRQAICSRLMAFYSLMVRTRGTVLCDPAHPSEDSSGSVVLEPLVIKAVATAPLSVDGQFDDLVLRTLMSASGDSAKLRETRTPSSLSTRVEPSIAVTDIVQELARLLFACDAARAGSSLGKPYEFHVFEQLCEPFATVTGAQNLKPLISRALESTRLSYAWLRSARVAESGRIEGIDMAQRDLHPQEVYQAELDLMGSLVELLRSLLGDEVTIQLLRTVWPLASLDLRTS